MHLTEQTQSDLKSILETLDQRIHELATETATSAEVAALQGLRANAAGLLGAA